jgi:serine/threonine-protein kinase SRPK3
MNGTDIKKAAINKAKQVAQAANGNGGKKRRKGQDLKPIITTEQQASQNAQNASSSPASTSAFNYKYVVAARTHTHTPHAQHIALACYCAHPIVPLSAETVLTRNPAVSRIRPRPSPSTRCTGTN